MAGKGWVSTARGDSLNLDDLIAKSKRPIGTQEEKSTIKKQKVPGTRRPINVRGFRPAHGEAKPKLAETVTEEKKRVPKAASTGGKKATSQADFTSIKVKKRASTKKPTGTVAAATSDALGDIMSGLESGSPNAVSAAEQEDKKPTRRKSSK